MGFMRSYLHETSTEPVTSLLLAETATLISRLSLHGIVKIEWPPCVTAWKLVPVHVR